MKNEDAYKLLINTFPNINIGVDYHGGIEKELANHVAEFTLEQWKVVLSRDTDCMFEDGIPHINWNTDRSKLFRAIERTFKKLTSWERLETWFHVVTSEYKSPTGVYLRLIERIPNTFSGGQHQFHIQIIDDTECTPVRTHTAVILGVDDNGTAYIQNQCTGTQEECEQFVEKCMKPGMFFKIMERK